MPGYDGRPCRVAGSGSSLRTQPRRPRGVATAQPLPQNHHHAHPDPPPRHDPPRRRTARQHRGRLDPGQGDVETYDVDDAWCFQDDVELYCSVQEGTLTIVTEDDWTLRRPARCGRDGRHRRRRRLHRVIHDGHPPDHALGGGWQLCVHLGATRPAAPRRAHGRAAGAIARGLAIHLKSLAPAGRSRACTEFAGDE